MTQLRAASTADGPGICDGFQAAGEEGLPWLPVLHTPEEDRAFFGGLVARMPAFAVAEDGFIVVSPGHVEQLYVHPRAWGSGIGGALLDRAKALHPDGLELWVVQRNERALRFYERRGFALVRTTDGAGNEEREPDALLAWRG